MKIEKDISLPIERGQWISRFESVSIIIACAVALVWMTEVQRYLFLILGPEAAFLRLAPIWYQVYFPIVLLTVAEIVRATINLVRPDWTLFRAIYSLFVHFGGLAVVYFLIRAGSWVTAADSAGGAGYAHAAQIVNRWIYYGLWITAIFSAAMLIIRVAPTSSFLPCRLRNHARPCSRRVYSRSGKYERLLLHRRRPCPPAKEVVPRIMASGKLPNLLLTRHCCRLAVC